MFHLLFVPRYLDYVQTDLGGLLRPVTQLSERTFSLRRLSLSPPLSVAIKHRAPVLFFPRHSHPTSPILRHPITGSKSLFSLSFRPPIHPSTHPSIPPRAAPLSLPQLHAPLFCADIKRLTTCLVAGLQCAGRGVLLSLSVYRYFGSQKCR